MVNHSLICLSHPLFDLLLTYNTSLCFIETFSFLFLVQQECIPQAVLGMDVICQAKSGMGKTVVFVLATLQQLKPVEGQVDTLVLCHTRELAYQICQEFLRFSKYLSDVKVKVFFGGIPIAQHRKLLETEMPNVVVGTPGRVLQLLQEKKLKLENLKRFILDECDQMLENLDMRRDIQAIFKATPHEKQVMMFSATLSKEIRPVCRKFTQHVSFIPVHCVEYSSRKLGSRFFNQWSLNS